MKSKNPLVAQRSVRSATRGKSFAQPLATGELRSTESLALFPLTGFAFLIRLGRILKRLGYALRSMCSRPCLNTRQRAARLQWARKHEKWTVCHWSRVLFSDEKIFRSLSDKPRMLVTRKRTERLAKDCVFRSSMGGPRSTYGAVSGGRG